MRISGVAGGDSVSVSQMGISATLHGRELLSLGYSVDEVVHAYGDLCQSVTDLAYELAVPFAVSEFRTLNRSLDNAIASAVTAFSDARDTESEVQTRAEAAARVDVLIHALRSSLATATYAVVAMEAGNLPMKGSTGNVLKKCISAMRAEIGGPTLDEVRATHAAD
ncbi:MAG: histidine kinase [Ramlibacter sp.]|nr:histidine kinase [Ramlibacter sp.]